MNKNKIQNNIFVEMVADLLPDGAPEGWFAPKLSENSSRSFEGLDLEKIEVIAKLCTKCKLCENRKNVVFDTGNRQQPLIAFVGEGPGADEDETGVPFVGRAGQLLTNAITNGLQMRREDLYICNIVKCRPPNNRAPENDEISSCLPYLFQQLKLVEPQIIITLGQTAHRALLKTPAELGITKIRGKWQEWEGIKVMPTLHPAYLLRNPPAKKDFWEDLKLVLKELGR